MTSTADGSVMWSVNQITNPQLSVTSDTAEAVDALGSTIATFNRGKKAEFSAENSIFDLSLLAAQNGVDKEIASDSAKIVVPVFETITVSGTTATLAHTPKSDVNTIYALKGDGTLGTKYESGVSATSTKFVYSEGSITLPTGLTQGSQLMVIYEYEKENAVAVTADAVNFPKAGKFIMEVLGTDVCDPTTLIHAYVVFPNAKLDAAFDYTFATDSTHSFKLIAQQAYCDSKKTLFQIVIPEED